MRVLEPRLSWKANTSVDKTGQAPLRTGCGWHSPRKDNVLIVRESETSMQLLSKERVSIAGAWSYDTNKVTMTLAQRERHKSITQIQSNIQKSPECSLLIHANTSILRNLNSVSAQSLTNQMRFCIYQAPVIGAQRSCTKVVM